MAETLSNDDAPGQSADPKHWRLAMDGDGIAWLSLDMAGGAANVLGSAVIEELGDVLDTLHAQRPRGLVIRSAKAQGFIAGADINEFTRLERQRPGHGAA